MHKKLLKINKDQSLFISSHDNILVDSFFKKLTQREKKHLSSLNSPSKKNDFIFSRYFIKNTFPHFVSHSFLANTPNKAISWPENLTGSLSHSRELIAFILHKKELGSVGVDIEETRVSEKVYQRITTKEERKRLDQHWDLRKEIKLLWTLTFSIKESLFKCFSPILNEDFVLKDCRISSLERDSKNFSGYYQTKNGEKVEAHGEYKFVKSQTDKVLVLSYCIAIPAKES